MSDQQIQILETLIVLVVYVVIFFLNKKVINNVLKNAHLQRTRRKIIVKALQLITSIAALVIIAGIWGLKQNEIAVFATTILTALGIAFFAQWSLLSNLTSSIILFFNHPVKLGDTIKVMDKDCPFEGEVTELTYFFIHLKTKNGEIITIPNSMVLQKSIAVIEKQKED
jgi:small-conductance mechanosensitive channel